MNGTRKTSRQPDAEFNNHGSIISLLPLTEAAQAWIDDYVETEEWQWFGGALCGEPRMMHDICEAMQRDGLICV